MKHDSGADAAPTAPAGHFGHSALAQRIAAEVADSLRLDAARRSPLNPARGGRLGPALVVGVFGEWGSGKSHLLAEVGRELAAMSGTPAAPVPGEPLAVTVQVHFNAWRYEREPVLLVPMLKVAEQALHDAVEAALPDATRRREQLRDHAALFSELVKGIYSSGGRELANAWLAAQGSPLQLPALSSPEQPAPPGLFARLWGGQARRAAERQVATPVRSLESLYFNFFDYLKGITGRNPKFLANIRQRLDQQGRGELWDRVTRVVEWIGTGETLADGGLLVNLVFIVDDLDRCLPEKAVEVLEAIKLFLDVEGCAFVLAVDEEVVERGIAHRYQVYSRGGGASAPITGAEYLEKLIHLPIRLPRPGGEEAQWFLADQWPDWYAAPPESDGRRQPNELAQLVATVTPPVPRKLQRVTSLLQLNEPLAGQLEGLGGTPLTAIEQRRWLVLVCALQLFAPALFRYLRVQGAWLLRELVDWRTGMRLNDLDQLREALRAESQAVTQPWELRNAHARERMPELLQEVWHSRSGFSILTWLEQVQEQAQRANADDKTLQRLLLLAVATPTALGATASIQTPEPPMAPVSSAPLVDPEPPPEPSPPSVPARATEPVAAPGPASAQAYELAWQLQRARLDNEFALWEPLAGGDVGGIERAISREGAALAGRLLPESLVDRWCQAASNPDHWLRGAQADDARLRLLGPLLGQGDAIRLAFASGRVDLLSMLRRPSWATRVDADPGHLVAWPDLSVIGLATPLALQPVDPTTLLNRRAWVSSPEVLHEDQNNIVLRLSADGEFGLQLALTCSDHTQHFRWMEPGDFLMGGGHLTRERSDPEASPQHAVAISRGFWIADTACTAGLYNFLRPDEQWPVLKLPVDHAAVGLNWVVVRSFLGWLNDLLPEGWFADLPTEAEWEYACRAGSTTRYWWGDQPLASLAPFGLAASKPRPVRSYPPNAWGLHDMPGAVREWCRDDTRLYTLQSLPLVDPTGPLETEYAAVRGGLREANGAPDRARLRKTDEFGDVGLRICLRFRPELS